MAGDPLYHDGMRELQDARDTRRLADRLAQTIVHPSFSEEDRAFIGRCAMFFVATADGAGQPECSYKGGLPGFVRVLDERTLAIPDYDGNGMYRTWGNLRVNPRIGLLFVDFENPRRLRVNGRARVAADDPLLADFPGAVFVVRVTAETIFPACPRYIHRMQLVEHSVYAPRPDYTPPVPAWKTFDAFHDALPARDRTGETIRHDGADIAVREKLPRPPGWDCRHLVACEGPREFLEYLASVGPRKVDVVRVHELSAAEIAAYRSGEVPLGELARGLAERQD